MAFAIKKTAQEPGPLPKMVEKTVKDPTVTERLEQSEEKGVIKDPALLATTTQVMYDLAGEVAAKGADITQMGKDKYPELPEQRKRLQELKDLAVLSLDNMENNLVEIADGIQIRGWFTPVESKSNAKVIALLKERMPEIKGFIEDIERELTKVTIRPYLREQRPGEKKERAL